MTVVVLTDKQVLLAQKICQGCLLADRTGMPRWRQGQLYCGRAIDKLEASQSAIYQCQMGFKVTQIH